MFVERSLATIVRGGLRIILPSKGSESLAKTK
jgi:hypothetical protein